MNSVYELGHNGGPARLERFTVNRASRADIFGLFSMFVIIGVIIVCASIIVGYGAHGDFAVFMQPFEVLIIVGAAFGAFLISNPKSVIMGVFKSPGRVLKGPPHKKASYVEFLNAFVRGLSAGQIQRDARTRIAH
jgi:flagellar motor component MotA